MSRDLRSSSAFRASLLMASACLAPSGILAEPVEQILSQARADYEDHAIHVAGIVSPEQMLARAGHALTTPLPQAAAPSAEFDLIDLRFILIEMARATGTNDQLSVLRAQPQGRGVRRAARVFARVAVPVAGRDGG